MATVVNFQRRRPALSGLSKGIASITGAVEQNRRKEQLRKVLEEIAPGMADTGLEPRNLEDIVRTLQARDLTQTETQFTDTETGKTRKGFIPRSEATGAREGEVEGLLPDEEEPEDTSQLTDVYRVNDDGSVRKLKMRVTQDELDKGELSKEKQARGFRLGQPPEEEEKDEGDFETFYKDEPILQVAQDGEEGKRPEGTLTFKEWKAKHEQKDGGSKTNMETRADLLLERMDLPNTASNRSRAMEWVEEQGDLVRQISSNFGTEREEGGFIFAGPKERELNNMATELTPRILMNPEEFGFEGKITGRTAAREAMNLAEKRLGSMDTASFKDQQEEIDEIVGGTDKEDDKDIFRSAREFLGGASEPSKERPKVADYLRENPEVNEKLGDMADQHRYTEIATMLIDEGVDPQDVRRVLSNMINKARKASGPQNRLETE